MERCTAAEGPGEGLRTYGTATSLLLFPYSPRLRSIVVVPHPRGDTARPRAASISDIVIDIQCSRGGGGLARPDRPVKIGLGLSGSVVDWGVAIYRSVLERIWEMVVLGWVRAVLGEGGILSGATP